MRNSLFLLLILFTACGKQVTISHSKLEALSDPSKAAEKNVAQQGRLLRTGVDVISLGSSSYNVSAYSSKQAKDFINSRPLGSQTSIHFTGKVQGKEIVLQTIKQL